MKVNMKSILLAVVILLVAGSVVFGQSAPAAPAATIRFQPYLSFWWRPLAYSPYFGDSYGDWNAWAFEQAGLKVTGTSGKIQAYVEVRGLPSSSRDYNKYDVETLQQTAGWDKPAYYAWGKYQFTDTGNLWAGKFKPLFGPVLYDWSQVGFGWQQKLQGGHTVSGFLLSPRDVAPHFQVTPGITGGSSRVDNEGLRLLVMEEYMSKTMMFGGGVLYDYNTWTVAEDSNMINISAFVSYFGIEKLTLTGEGALIMRMQEKGTTKDTSKPTETEDFGLGYGLYASASYKVLNPLSISLTFQLENPLVGAAKSSASGEITSWSANTASSGLADGDFSMANLGIGVTYQPGPGFYINPAVSVNLRNAFNDYQPKTKSGDDGNKVGIGFSVLFRWEPSFTVRL